MEHIRFQEDEHRIEFLYYKTLDRVVIDYTNLNEDYGIEVPIDRDDAIKIINYLKRMYKL